MKNGGTVSAGREASKIEIFLIKYSCWKNPSLSLSNKLEIQAHLKQNYILIGHQYSLIDSLPIDKIG